MHLPPDKLFLIAGPCVIESEAHALKMARAIAAIARALDLPYIFKASYDKANRTSISSFRGPGLDEGTRILQRVRDEVGVPVLTDVHDQHDCERVAEHADVLQIPAFLCRQTDLLIAAARTGKTVNIKKGQFAAPADMRHAVQKVRDARASETTVRMSHPERVVSAKGGMEFESEGDADVILTERGTTFGYHNLVVDMRSLAIMRAFAPVVFDATHSVQLPSATSGTSGGEPQFIPLLARAAVAAGIDGIFMEVHDNPAQALSDGANALHLDKLQQTLEELLRIHAAVAAPAS